MNYPSWIDNQSGARKRRWQGWWAKPWTIPTTRLRAPTFKKRMWEHGKITPNFSRSEFASKSGDRCGCPGQGVPADKRHAVQFLCIRLEQCRHDNGDRPFSLISGWRSPCHNKCVGGVSNSQHVLATAADVAVARGTTLHRSLENRFSNGGIGYQSYVGGTIRHVDTGPKRRWVY